MKGLTEAESSRLPHVVGLFIDVVLRARAGYQIQVDHEDESVLIVDKDRDRRLRVPFDAIASMADDMYVGLENLWEFVRDFMPWAELGWNSSQVLLPWLRFKIAIGAERVSDWWLDSEKTEFILRGEYPREGFHRYRNKETDALRMADAPGKERAMKREEVEKLLKELRSELTDKHGQLQTAPRRNFLRTAAGQFCRALEQEGEARAMAAEEAGKEAPNPRPPPAFLRDMGPGLGPEATDMVAEVLIAGEALHGAVGMSTLVQLVAERVGMDLVSYAEEADPAPAAVAICGPVSLKLDVRDPEEEGKQTMLGVTAQFRARFLGLPISDPFLQEPAEPASP